MQITTHLKRKSELLKALEVLPDSFSEAHLDIRDHLQNNIFLLNNKDLAVMYKINGIADETMTMEELEQNFASYLKGLRSVCLGVPNYLGKGNCVVQVICSQRVINEPLDLKINGKKHTYSDSPCGKLLKAEGELLFDNLNLVERSFYLTVRYTPLKLRANVSEFLKPFLGAFKGENKLIEQELSPILESYQLFEDELQTFESQFPDSFSLERQNTEQYMRFTQNILHATHETKVLPEDYNIHKRVYAPDFAPSSDVINLPDNKTIDLFYLDQAPSSYGLGKFKHFLDAIPFRNWDIVWNFSHGSKEYSDGLPAKETWFGKKQSSTEEYENYLSFKQGLNSLTPHGVQSIRLIGYNLERKTDGMLQSLGLDYIGARVIRESQIPIHLLKTSLPFNCPTSGNKMKKRSKRIKLDKALAFLPLYDGPLRLNGVRWHSSRNLMPTRFNPFAGEGNKMGAMLGQSRAGKSVGLNQLIMEFFEWSATNAN